MGKKNAKTQRRGDAEVFCKVMVENSFKSYKIGVIGVLFNRKDTMVRKFLFNAKTQRRGDAEVFCKVMVENPFKSYKIGVIGVPYKRKDAMARRFLFNTKTQRTCKIDFIVW